MKERVNSPGRASLQEKNPKANQNHPTKNVQSESAQGKNIVPNQIAQNAPTQSPVEQFSQSSGQIFAGVPNPRGGFWVPADHFSQWNSPQRWNKGVSGKGSNSTWQNPGGKSQNSPWQNSGKGLNSPWQNGKGVNSPWQNTGGRGHPSSTKEGNGATGKGKGQMEGKGKGRGKGNH